MPKDYVFKVQFMFTRHKPASQFRTAKALFGKIFKDEVFSDKSKSSSDQRFYTEAWKADDPGYDVDTLPPYRTTGICNHFCITADILELPRGQFELRIEEIFKAKNTFNEAYLRTEGCLTDLRRTNANDPHPGPVIRRFATEQVALGGLRPPQAQATPVFNHGEEVTIEWDLPCHGSLVVIHVDSFGAMNLIAPSGFAPAETVSNLDPGPVTLPTCQPFSERKDLVMWIQDPPGEHQIIAIAARDLGMANLPKWTKKHKVVPLTNDDLDCVLNALTQNDPNDRAIGITNYQVVVTNRVHLQAS